MTRRARVAAGLVLVFTGSMLAASRQLPQTELRPTATRAELADLTNQAYRAGFNLDYGEALARARSAVKLGPDQPSPHRTLAAITWMLLLFQRGACTVEFFMAGVSKSPKTLPQPSAELQAEFHTEITRAIDLALERSRINPKDIEARYDLGSAYAVQASYSASVEGSTMAAFGSARHAFNAQEEVLSRDPTRSDARTTVGTYRYMIASLSLPTRWLAYLAGFGGGKERGIAMVEEAARTATAQTEARAALLLIYSREGRHGDALRIIRELQQVLPRNRILVLEEGTAAWRSGRAAEAETILTRGMAALDQDDRPKFPGERAQWLYTRGAARISLNHLPDAQADLNAVLQNGPAGWIRGRTYVQLGKTYDLLGRRQEAIASYRQGRTICDANGDDGCTESADRYIKTPFHF